MKVKPVGKRGGVVVELGSREGQIPSAAAAGGPVSLPVFKLKKILVPVDFSERSMRALQYALPLAEQFGAEVTLLHVVQAYLPVPEMSTMDVTLMQQQMREAGAQQLESLRKSVEAKVELRTVLKLGDPYFETIHAAKDLGVDLIILSTHGRTGLAHVFLGSTAERVVRHASCPVLVVREHEREFVDVASGGGTI
jgi:nucleotide-binding universal stress UspA family protein